MKNVRKGVDSNDEKREEFSSSLTLVLLGVGGANSCSKSVSIKV